MRKEYIVEKELADAFYKFSFGKLTEEQARQKAIEVAPKFDLSNEIFWHKGLNWYVKQVLAAMGIKPTIDQLRSLALSRN